jgi:hypothetical protein
MKAFFATTLGKVLIGIVMAAVVAGGGYGIYQAVQAKPVAAVDVTTEATTEEPTTADTGEATTTATETNTEKFTEAMAATATMITKMTVLLFLGCCSKIVTSK